MSTVRDRYDFILRCKDCGNEMSLVENSVSEALGAPISSRLEYVDEPERSVTIYKRMVMLWVPDTCPKCANLRAI